MDPLIALYSNKRDTIYAVFSQLDLQSTVNALSDYSNGNQKLNPDIADMILDLMNERFNYKENPYPFLIAAYILNLPRRIDEFVTDDVDSDFLRKLKYSYRP
jgi:hypothetical protein